LDNDAGMGLFGLQPKRSHYAKHAKYRKLFARKGDYICSYHGPLKTPAECITHPSMYIFTDPSDPLGRYIDSWTPETGVTSYGGYVNEHFQDEQVNCTIKWTPQQSTAGIYAKRDIYLNEELFTGYGKPQWVYTIKFFAHLLSPNTIREAIKRYNILPSDQLDPCLASLITTQQPPPLPQSSTAQLPTEQTPTAAPIMPVISAPPNSTCPYGTTEGVAVAPSTMPSAGNGLYGIRPLSSNPHLFAKKGQFICTYATQKHQIPAGAAKTSNSRYMWSTNRSTRHSSKALYFDAADAPHYGKYLNDLWNSHANNCELR
jgi:hypothetical protein